MKNLLFILITFTIIGCSSNNCSEEKQSINDYYDQQILQVNNNPGPTGPDYRQIGLLEKEREKKLNEACN